MSEKLKRFIFTDRFIDAQPPVEKAGTEYCIREAHGFTLRVLKSGIKTWQYIYTINGKRHRLNLGRYDKTDKINHTDLKTARDRFDKARELLKVGINPLSPPPPPPPPSVPDPVPKTYTVSELIDDYITHCELNKLARKTIYDKERTLKHDVLPFFGTRAVNTIEREDAIELVELVASRAPGQGRNTAKEAKAMFEYAVGRRKAQYNPFAKITKNIPLIIQKRRVRVLSDEEIKHLWKELYNKPADDRLSPGSPLTRAAILLILVTAQRPGEVIGAAKSEVFGDWWIIPVARIKTRNKNPFNQRVFLTSLAKSLLPDVSGELFFPSPDKKGESSIRENTLSQLFSRKNQKFNGVVIRPYLELPEWWPHDLRRTAATGLSKLGCSDEIIDAILNHAKKGTISTYNQNRYDKEKEFWLNKWSNYIIQLVSTP